jgi:hypothetical protein
MLKLFQSTDRSFGSNGDKVIKAFRAKVHKADNVYRTKEHIVVQKLTYVPNSNGTGPILVSNDIFFSRNELADAYYEKIFYRRAHINGRRIKTAMYTRVYLQVF